MVKIGKICPLKNLLLEAEADLKKNFRGGGDFLKI